MTSPIKLVATGLPVAAMCEALAAHPELWDRRTARTASPESPHHGLSDIWVRWTQDGGQPQPGADFVWYADSLVLPARQLAYTLMGAVCGDELGGVLITRIPPGVECKPHIDHGWHAGRFQKFGIQLRAAPAQRFEFPEHDAGLETTPGDLFWFDNSKTHRVTNPTDAERVTMIVCIRTEWRP